MSSHIVEGSKQCCTTIMVWQTRSRLFEQGKGDINDVLVRIIRKANRFKSFDVFLELGQFRLDFGLVANAKESFEVAEGESL